MKRKNMTKIIAILLTFAIMVISFSTVSEQIQAADTEVVKYVVVDYNSFAAAIESNTAPETEGYLFGGWYKYDETDKTGTVIRTVSDVTSADVIAAKYIRADMSGIACQLNIDKENGKRDMRIVSLVDSSNYSTVGFNVYGRKYNETTGQYYEWVMYKYGSDRAAKSTTVYSGLKEYSDSTNYTIKTPADVFGTDAEGFRFTTMLLRGVPKTEYDTIVAIKPYWITADGTYVEGMGEFNRVSDYANDIVNISVNLQQADEIAAGLLQVTYDANNFEYQGADYGRVFKEMEIVKVADGTIKCVGNVGVSTDNSPNPNDVYVNLRFKKTQNNTLGVGEAVFQTTIPENGFCALDEEDVNVSIPIVKY